MQDNRARKTARQKGSSNDPKLRSAQMKSVTKSAIKKFGPFLLTGLAAIAEHHWLKKDDSSTEEGNAREHRSRSSRSHSGRGTHQKHNIEGEEEAEVRALKDELARMRDELKNRGDEALIGDDGARAIPVESAMPPSFVRGPRSLDSEHVSFQHEQPEDFVKMPFAPTPPVSYPAPFDELRATRPPQLYDPLDPSIRGLERNRGFESSDFSSRRRQYRQRSNMYRNRNSKIQRRSIRENEDKSWHATKVAAVAGLVEGLHVDDGKGDWVGMKGVRVGTTAAATFGATYLREREPRDYRMREVVSDVGTGILVSGLVYGKARDSRPSEKRRWTLC
ncbi:uncharacterized protein RSE6_01924 [Rhynchosporium secalis]|uniref:Uncharacterized protein n=1 Tax=Rhynchosporium secalis TaxID=38038 RepID=A0A1E1M0M2_RHYSE|nr:uncharacterized protein RSE6_01924 [Rhynchosporium secalis]